MLPAPGLLAVAAALSAGAAGGAPDGLAGSAPASSRITAGVREALQALRKGGWDGKSRAIVVDIANQRLLMFASEDRVERSWRVSTSRYGVGSEPRSYRTPLGLHRIWQKSGAAARPGQPLKGGEPADAPVPEEGGPDRVYITSRALKLEGLEEQNRTSRARGIWIHGTSAERLIGRPASIGCVRMRNVDAIELFDLVPEGTLVYITDRP